MTPMRSDLPSGTVTFLFTDVEGSTRLLHSLGAEGYAAALAEHRRLIRAACGGQVLVSHSTAALIEPSNSLLQALSDLGEHRLKDLSAPERVYQLGDDEFGPLQTLHQTNLPVPATPFLGRERELS